MNRPLRATAAVAALALLAVCTARVGAAGPFGSSGSPVSDFKLVSEHNLPDGTVQDTFRSASTGAQVVTIGQPGTVFTLTVGDHSVGGSVSGAGDAGQGK